MKLINSLCVLGIAAAFVVSIPTALQAQESTIAGTWTINEEESDGSTAGDGSEGARDPAGGEHTRHQGQCPRRPQRAGVAVG